MNGVEWDKLDEETKQQLEEHKAGVAETEAEGMWVSGEYQALYEHYLNIEKRHRRIRDVSYSILKEMEEENMGDA